MKRVVMFSGGLGSWMTAKLVAEKYGTDNLTLLFADVKGDSTSPHVGEDEDTYRFINEAAANVGGELVAVKDGRDIWQVFKDDRFLGNSRLANCSKLLKQKPCREWLEANTDPANTTVYVGIDWTETHRMSAIVKGYLPWAAEAPLTEAPYLTRDQVTAACEAEGIEIPRLYKAGFPHNNCGGFCVRAGQAQFELLLREHPERYEFHEAKEQEIRDYLGKDVSILTSRAGGTRTPVTLRRFREDLERQPSMFDEFDFGGCGCFLDAEDDAA
jgi:3'-phosphoadenosine 5'-phosphosulfate sulfotransferase (PAPS reductase)/FAD synthetase